MNRYEEWREEMKRRQSERLNVFIWGVLTGMAFSLAMLRLVDAVVLKW